MAYPEPIPEVKGKDAKKFDEKLNNFSLSDDQIKMYSKAKRFFNR